MEERLLISSIIAIFIFAVIMGSFSMTGQVVNPGGDDQPTCTENWQCSDWSECSMGGEQTRECTDVNECGTANNRPVQSRFCEVPGAWHLVERFADANNEETDVFYVPSDEWRIDWNCFDAENHEEEGTAYISVYRQGSTKPIATASGMCVFAEQEDLVFDERGWYFINVQTAFTDWWTMDVEAYY